MPTYSILEGYVHNYNGGWILTTFFVENSLKGFSKHARDFLGSF